MRAKGRSGNPRGRPHRRPRGHFTISLQHVKSTHSLRLLWNLILIGPAVLPKAPMNPKPQPLIHTAKHLVVIRAEKTYIGLERERIFTVDVIAEKISKSKIAEDPCPQFKERTSSNLRGLEFTFVVTVPHVTPSIVFGPFLY